MDFDFLNRITEITRNAGDKASDFLEINRLNAHIRSEERNIAEITSGIGAYYLEKFDEGAAMDENVEAMYQEILNCRNKIADSKDQLEKLQTKKPAPAPVKNLTCSFCGAVNPGDRKFCGECGNKLESPEEPIIINDGDHCPECGAKLIKGLKFCGECGAKIEVVPENKETAETK